MFPYYCAAGLGRPGWVFCNNSSFVAFSATVFRKHQAFNGSRGSGPVMVVGMALYLPIESVNEDRSSFTTL